MAGDERNIRISVPEALEAGVYANGAGVWHTAHEFTLDFLTLLNSDPGEPEVVPARVVSRVKVPPSVIFDLLRAINMNMTLYEQKYGAIRPVEEAPSDEPPDA
jgi:Protein of unknown function (DUF3467)